MKTFRFPLFALIIIVALCAGWTWAVAFSAQQAVTLRKSESLTVTGSNCNLLLSSEGGQRWLIRCEPPASEPQRRYLEPPKPQAVPPNEK